VSEYTVEFLGSYSKTKAVFDFIEEAVSQTSSCMIVSMKNKCSPIAVAIGYLILKFHWSYLRALEYINSKKVDIEMTRAILKSLIKLEAIHEQST